MFRGINLCGAELNAEFPVQHRAHLFSQLILSILAAIVKAPGHTAYQRARTSRGTVLKSRSHAGGKRTATAYRPRTETLSGAERHKNKQIKRMVCEDILSLYIMYLKEELP